MNGLLVLFLLILIAALPVILVYLWFRIFRFPFSLPWFLFFLLSGAAALFVALFFQRLFPASLPENSHSAVIFNIFCKVALTEELGRLLMLLLFFKILHLMGKGIAPSPKAADRIEVKGRFGDHSAGLAPGVFSGDNAKGGDTVWGAVAGLLSGLGFALIESASYGAADLGITFLRAFTSAPLHGACGARVGASAAAFRDQPISSLIRFLSAVAIHGMYNFILHFPGIPTVLVIFAAFSALGSSVLFIHGGIREAKD
jgi:RsiW-degrading membrane proteinase PrsW (M82 family)